MRQLQLTPSAHSFLDHLSPNPFRHVVRKVLSLLKNPSPPDAKQLEGYPYYRTDIGEYRIIYRFDENVIYIALVEKRNDDEVYKKLKRMM